MNRLLYLFKSYLKTPQYWIKNILWRLPKTISGIEVIFVIGVPRSGTTLLQKILEANSGLFSIHTETAIFSWQNLFDPRKRHFELTENENIDLFKSSKDNVDFFSNGVKLLTERNDHKVFIEKTPQHIIYLGFLLKHFPKAKFVHIVRDGRDCYCSARKHPWIPQSESVTAFAGYYKKCLNQVIKEVKNPRLFTVKYEEMVMNPEKEISEIMLFLNVGFEQMQLDISAIKEDPRSKLKHFERLNEPISTSSIGRWELQLNMEEKKRFNKIAGAQLKYFGYSAN